MSYIPGTQAYRERQAQNDGDSSYNTRVRSNGYNTSCGHRGTGDYDSTTSSNTGGGIASYIPGSDSNTGYSSNTGFGLWYHSEHNGGAFRLPLPMEAALAVLFGRLLFLAKAGPLLTVLAAVLCMLRVALAT